MSEEASFQLQVHVIPGASKVQIGGTRNGALRVWVRSQAVDGAATAEAGRVIAKAFGVKDRQVTCLRGFTSRSKVFALEGSRPDLNRQLELLLDDGDAASS